MVDHFRRLKAKHRAFLANLKKPMRNFNPEKVELELNSSKVRVFKNLPRLYDLCLSVGPSKKIRKLHAQSPDIADLRGYMYSVLENVDKSLQTPGGNSYDDFFNAQREITEALKIRSVNVLYKEGLNQSQRGSFSDICKRIGSEIKINLAQASKTKQRLKMMEIYDFQRYLLQRIADWSNLEMNERVIPLPILSHDLYHWSGDNFLTKKTLKPFTLDDESVFQCGTEEFMRQDRAGNAIKTVLYAFNVEGRTIDLNKREDKLLFNATKEKITAALNEDFYAHNRIEQTVRINKMIARELGADIILSDGGHVFVMNSESIKGIKKKNSRMI